jgi:hypothetical protein
MPTVFSNVFCLFAAEGGATPTKYQIWNYSGHVKLRAIGEKMHTFKGIRQKKCKKCPKIKENYEKTPRLRAVVNANRIFKCILFVRRRRRRNAHKIPNLELLWAF